MLEIQTIKPELSYDIKHAQLLMQTKRPDLDISTTPRKLETDTVPVVVEIDTSESKNYLGVGSIFVTSKMLAQDGQQHAFDYISKVVEQGDRLADLRDKKSTVAEFAGENAQDFYNSNGLTDLNPPLGPKFDISGGTININYTPSQLNMNPKTYPVDAQYIPGDFNIEMIRYPELYIQYVGNNVDYKV